MLKKIPQEIAVAKVRYDANYQHGDPPRWSLCSGFQEHFLDLRWLLGLLQGRLKVLVDIQTFLRALLHVEHWLLFLRHLLILVRA